MSSTSTTRLALCTDTHFWPGCQQQLGGNGSQLQPWSDQILTTLLAEISAIGPDLVFHLGDLTCGGGSFEMPEAEFYATVDNTVAALRGLPGQFAILPGNHDCPPGGDWRYAEQTFDLGPGLGQTIDLPQARLVLLNAQGHSAAQIAETLPADPTYGWVSQAELARLDEALASAGERPVLVFVHQLLQPWAGEQEWKDLYGTENAAEVLAVLARYGNVRAVFQGHAHRLDVLRTDLGGQACTFVVSPAIIQYPLAWLQLDLADHRLQVAMKRLPLPELAQRSLTAGEDAWRAGWPAWAEFEIPL